ncbi:hypothetical protein RclHR1_04210006 [Rhizophagus clarus]|uniref:Uncharacterized protein n=1 Tax=Rhizophagus clarus TaxID=94130 RepID=A0A2Z6RX49_9GLOM|nr:hypothetical protein RclHR1_04210006 [Rhizophagus clarus]
MMTRRKTPEGGLLDGWFFKILGWVNFQLFGRDNLVKLNERPKWKRALEAFKRASAIYKAKYNKTPVIVYNNINKLANINSKALDTLQDDAKMYTDYQEYIAVFITSEGSVLRKMRSRSVWSRAERPIEISDLSKEKSIKYLTEKHMINETKAEKLYDLVGVTL